MDEDPKNEDIVITGHSSTIEVQAVRDDQEIQDQSFIVEDQEKHVGDGRRLIHLPDTKITQSKYWGGGQ